MVGAAMAHCWTGISGPKFAAEFFFRDRVPCLGMVSAGLVNMVVVRPAFRRIQYITPEFPVLPLDLLR